MAAQKSSSWVVILWDDAKGSEQGREPKWADADGIRQALKASHPGARISIDDAKTWDRAQAA